MNRKKFILIFTIIILIIAGIILFLVLNKKDLVERTGPGDFYDDPASPNNAYAIEEINGTRVMSASLNDSRELYFNPSISEITIVPTMTPTSTPTSTPTPSPSPTSTPIPTETPIPTNTSTPTPTPLEDSYYIYDGTLTDEELRDMAALVYLEAGGENYMCQKGIASVIINRMVYTNSSLDDVMYAPNAFSPAKYIKSTTPSESCINAVNDVLTNGTIFPLNVLAFRADYYHDFGTPYMRIDDVFFTIY